MWFFTCAVNFLIVRLRVEKKFDERKGRGLKLICSFSLDFILEEVKRWGKGKGKKGV